MDKEKIPSIICIGGANVDRKAKIIHEMSLGSSNPVRSVISCGGVARNIAEYLGRLGCDSYLITYLGNDREGEWIREKAEPFINLSYTYVHPTEKTGSYTAILDPNGDMVIGIAEMGIYDSMSRNFIEEHWHHIAISRLVVLDTNFSKDIASYIVERCYQEQIPLCVVPGSGAKADKLPSNLRGVSWLIVNKEEAEILSGVSITCLIDFRHAAMRLIEKGVQKVVITRGKEGVFYKVFSGEEGYITSPRVDVVDVTGAGDGFVSGLLYADSKGMELEDACKYGMSCSIISLETDETVYQQLNEELLEETYQHYFESR